MDWRRFRCRPTSTSRRPDVFWRRSTVQSVVSSSNHRGRCPIVAVDPRSAWRNVPQQREGRYAGIVFSLLLNVFACPAYLGGTSDVACGRVVRHWHSRPTKNQHTHATNPDRAHCHHHHKYTDSGASLSSPNAFQARCRLTCPSLARSRWHQRGAATLLRGFK